MYEYFAIILVILIFALSSIIPSGSTSWYKNLKKSPANPPPYVFMIVWIILYAFIAYSWYMSIAVKNTDNMFLLNFLFTLNMLLNYAWSVSFFASQMPTLALVIVCILIILTAVIAYYMYIWVNKIAFSFMIVYLAWLVYALYLNSYVVAKN